MKKADAQSLFKPQCHPRMKEAFYYLKYEPLITLACMQAHMCVCVRAHKHTFKSQREELSFKRGYLPLSTY